MRVFFFEGVFSMNPCRGDLATAKAVMLCMPWLFPFPKMEASFLLFHEKSQALCAWLSCCGEWGIRTPGTSRYNGFQDRRNRPLCQLSEAKVVNDLELTNPFEKKWQIRRKGLFGRVSKPLLLWKMPSFLRLRESLWFHPYLPLNRWIFHVPLWIFPR